MAELFHKGGPTMFMIVAMILPTLVMVILHIVMARAWSAWISTGLIALTLAIGLYGTMQGRSITDRAVASVEGRDREMWRTEGYKEASLPIKAAALINSIFAVGVLVGELRRRKRANSVV